MSQQTPRTRRIDEQLLARYAREREPRQLAELVERYQPLSRSLANRYRAAREPFEDLAQVADLGLVKAIQGYDPEREVTFTAYAVPTILGELRRHFRDRVWNVRLPRALQESTATVESALDGLTEELGRAPSTGELAAATGLSDEETAEALVARLARWTASFEAPAGGEEDDPISPADLIGAEDPGYDSVEADFACSTAELDERERTAVYLRFALGMKQVDVGRQLGCSQMQVSRISRNGLNKLLAAVKGEPPSKLAA
jgi:RNA polymerase sigma-B factor